MNKEILEIFKHYVNENGDIEGGCFQMLVEDINAAYTKNRLPLKQKLTELTREYADEFCGYEKNTDLSFNINIIVQKDFMTIVRWLREKGF